MSDNSHEKNLSNEESVQTLTVQRQRNTVLNMCVYPTRQPASVSVLWLLVDLLVSTLGHWHVSASISRSVFLFLVPSLCLVLSQVTREKVTSADLLLTFSLGLPQLERVQGVHTEECRNSG